MKVTAVSVEIKKMVSDGNYGHESAQIALSAEVEEGDDFEQALRILRGRAVEHVRSQLGESPALRVRTSLRREERDCWECHQAMGDFEPGQMHAACRELVDERQRQRGLGRVAEADGELKELPF